MDNLDHAVIECLLHDGRASYVEVADTIGLSVPATKRRVDRLVRDKVITGFTALIEPEVLGWNLQAHVQLYTMGTVAFDRMRRDLGSVPEVVEAFTVTGPADATIRVVAGNAEHLERVISRLRNLEYVRQTDTTMLLSTLLQRPAGHRQQTALAP